MDNGLDESPKKLAPKSGRRAKQNGDGLNESKVDTTDLFSGDTLNIANNKSPNNTEDKPQKRKRIGGWEEESINKGSSARRPINPDYEDERLKAPKELSDDESEQEDNIPTIPDLDTNEPERTTNDVAVAPRELDHDLSKHLTFLMLDNEIDLKLLARDISSEQDVQENDDYWDWDQLFTDVTSGFQDSDYIPLPA